MPILGQEMSCVQTDNIILNLCCHNFSDNKYNIYKIHTVGNQANNDAKNGAEKPKIVL